MRGVSPTERSWYQVVHVQVRLRDQLLDLFGHKGPNRSPDGQAHRWKIYGAPRRRPLDCNVDAREIRQIDPRDFEENL